MQQSPQLMNITTEQIQKYLDENKQLIMAILENQNQGKFAENASFQAQLQQNLMYLAKIADAQAPPTSSQMPPQSTVQQEQYAQAAQAAMAKQHPGFLAPKLPFPLNEQQQQQSQQLMYLQQQQLNQQQMGLRSAGPSGTYQGVQSGLGNNFMNFQGIKQDSSEDGADEGQNPAFGHNTRDIESMRLK